MPEINLPTAAKQDEILAKVSNSSSGFFENIISETSEGVTSVLHRYGTGRAGDTSGIFKTALEITGGGVLYELYCVSNSITSSSRTHQVRITIDDNEPFLLVNNLMTGSTNIGLLTNPILFKSFRSDKKIESFLTGEEYDATKTIDGNVVTTSLLRTSNLINGGQMPLKFNYLKIEHYGSDQYVHESYIKAYYKLGR